MAKTSFYSGTGTNSTEVSAIDSLKTAAENAQTAAETAQASAETAASNAATSAATAEGHKNAITGLTTSTGAAGSNVSYDSSTGVLTVPRGDTGATGPQGPAGADSTVAGPQGPQGPAGADGADASPYTHPNHSGEVTSTGDGATVISDNVVDADNLKVTGNGTTSQFLRSDGDGTFTWATPTDTNTTYSAATTSAEGLMSANDKTKLDGIAASANNYSHPNHTGDVTSLGDGATTIAADAITGAKIADDAVDSEHIADGAIDLAHMSANSVDSDQYVDGSIDTAHIGDDQVTYAKIQNVSATNVVLGRDSSGAGVIEEISASNLRTILNVEDGADVTDTTNVTAAGALMDSEVNNLAQVKAFDSSDYATAAQGSTADAAMPKAGGTFSGDVIFADNEYAKFGDNTDMMMGHSDPPLGGDEFNFIHNFNHDLFIRNLADDKDVIIASDNGSGDYVEYFRADGSTGETKLFHYGNEKLKTQSGGVDVTGNITVSGTVDGRDIATNIPSSLGTAGQVLTVNSGASAAEWAAASGGGGNPDLYADSANGSAVTPTANAGGSYNSVAIGNGADIGSGRGDSIAIGTDALANQSQALAIGRSATVNSSGTWGTAVGRNSIVNGQAAVSLGNSYGSGSYGFSAVIDNNSIYGASSSYAVAIGKNAYANGSYSVAIGGSAPIAGSFGAISLGYETVSNGTYATALGNRSTATAQSSVALGTYAKSDIQGKLAYSSERFGLTGDSQAGLFVLRCDTTDATPEKLQTTAGTQSVGSTNQVVLPNDSVFGFTGTVIARENSSQTDDFAVWEIKGGAVRGANAASTTLGSYNINKISESTGAANWSIALSADTTNGAVSITVTGEASHSIRWVATVNTTEVTY